MSHMVIFRTPEGKPGYQPAETVQDAVEIVERLRNDEGVENVRIFRLEELSFEYRPYYKVELAGMSTGAPAEADQAPAAAIGGEQPAPSADGPSGSDESIRDEHGGQEHGGQEHGGQEHGGQEHGAEMPSAVVAEHPPWAAPPPPPPPPGGEMPTEHGGEHDDEFSGAGQRRGLFGR